MPSRRHPIEGASHFVKKNGFGATNPDVSGKRMVERKKGRGAKGKPTKKVFVSRKSVEILIKDPIEREIALAMDTVIEQKGELIGNDDLISSALATAKRSSKLDKNKFNYNRGRVVMKKLIEKGLLKIN
jgi:hypothetical protein